MDKPGGVVFIPTSNENHVDGSFGDYPGGRLTPQPRLCASRLHSRRRQQIRQLPPKRAEPMNVRETNPLKCQSTTITDP
jgi:hypothetical protein